MQLFYVQCQHSQSMQEVVCPLRSEAGSEGVEDEVDSHKNTIHVQFFFFFNCNHNLSLSLPSVVVVRHFSCLTLTIVYQP